ncbi:MAG TPA: accessory factor UbiK family protein [Gammaproteobacteria bacterium]|nr:accessory factor UbiK family protein [Gammaproteobacteria bacterium]
MSTRSGFDPGIIDDLARRLHEAVPQALRDMQQDLEQNFKAVLQSTLARLELVTREEFDVQVALLERTREKLDVLQARLDRLEAGVPRPPGTSAAD